MLKVDIGCGDSKPPGYIGVDICSGPGVDIVADISKVLPFHDNSVDELRAYDVIEHLPDRINTMNEIWRVCKPGAKVDLLVPSSDGRGAFQDPTHVSFWNINSFYYYSPDFPGYYHLCRKYGFQGAFRILHLEDRDSGSGIIHVQTLLEVVKPAPAVLQLQTNHSQANQPSATSNQQADVLKGANHAARPTITFPKIAAFPALKTRPFWSVMVPVYNPDLDYLRQTLTALIGQAPSEVAMQIEVVDDASSQDGIAGLVDTIGQGRITYSRNAQNLGLLENWNHCIHKASGEWIHLLHQDDLVLPEFYAQLRAGIESRPELGAAFCRHYHIDAEGAYQYLSPLERETPGVIENWIERIGSAQRVQFAAIAVKRSTYEDLGGFYLGAGSAADWEMWKRIATFYPVWFEPEPLACYRLHDESESSRLAKLGRNIADTRRAIEISETYLPAAIAPQLSNQAYEYYAQSALASAKYSISQGEFAAAITQLREALHCSCSSAIQAALIALLLEVEPEAATPNLLRLSHQIQCLHQGTLDSGNSELEMTQQHLAEQLLEISSAQLEEAYAGEVGKLHQILLRSEIKNFSS